MDTACGNCYCCPKPSNPGTSSSQTAMDLDSALSELGMLSSVTDSRKQYLQERSRCDIKTKFFAPRGRNLSEPGLAGAGTPSNSPTKAGSVCQVIQLNSHFVTSLTTGLALSCGNHSVPSTSSSSCSLLKPNPIDSPIKECLDFGEKYKQVELEQDARANRLSRLKVARVKRFRRPYELPWRSSLQQAYSKTETSLIYAVNQDQYTPFVGISTPEKAFRPADNITCSSNASTPEKSRRNGVETVHQQTVTRSKSLDDLDLSKLQLAETENQQFMQEHKEIDNVSQHLKDLHVQE